MSSLPGASSRIRAFALLVTGPILASVVLAAPRASGPTISITGSDTMLLLNREFAAEYARVVPSVPLDVAGGGSEVGISALMTGKVNIAAASRAMKEAELEAFQKHTGRRPEEIVVALDGLAVYVHASNPVTTLTLAQVARIMTGEIRNWREAGGPDLPIEVFTRDHNSGTRSFMQDHVLGKQGSFVEGAREFSTTERLIANVSISPGGIGYGGIAYAKGARVLRIAPRAGEFGIAPSRESILSGRYPLARPLYYYVDPGAMDAKMREFLAWIRGRGGRHVVENIGYFPPAEVEGDVSSGAPPKPPDHAGVALSPANTASHGFDLAVVARAASVRDSGHVVVMVRIGRSSPSLQRVQSFALAVGDLGRLPLALDGDATLQFELRKNLVERTTVSIVTGDPGRDGAVFEVPLAAFCTVE